jgi:hypothetical protein
MTKTTVFKIEIQNKLHISNIYDGAAACRHNVVLLLRDRPSSSSTPMKHYSTTSIVPPWLFNIFT